MLDLLTSPLPPYAYNLIGIAVIAFFALRGYLRGLLKELSSILGLAGSIVLAKPLGALIQGFLPLENVPAFLHSLTAMTVGALLGYVFVRLALFALIKVCKWDREWKGKTKLFLRLGGAGIGGLFGMALVLIFSWYILLVGQLSVVALQRSPQAQETFMQKLLLFPAKLTEAHWQGLEESALGTIAQQSSPVPDTITDGIEIISEVSQDPEKMQRLIEYEPIKEMMQIESVQNLATNEEIQALAEQGDILGVINHPAVQEMLADPDVQEALQNIDTDELRQLLQETE